MEHYDDFLEHYGVKGMRWGKHKRKNQYQVDASETKNNADTYKTQPWRYSRAGRGLSGYGDARTNEMQRARLWNSITPDKQWYHKKGASDIQRADYMRMYAPYSDYKIYEESKRRKEKKSKDRAKKKVELYLSSLKGK